MQTNLYIYQQLFLLLLKDKEGTIFSSIFYQQALAGAFVADLLLSGHINVIQKKRTKLVELLNSTPIGDELLDECLEKIKNAKRRASIQTWVSRLSSLRKMKHRVAETLCQRGILQMQEDSILLLFKRKIYPEINPVPEKELIRKLQRAIFSDVHVTDPEIVVLVALCQGADVLRHIFDKKELKKRKKRIEQIINGEVIGKATKEVIDAVQTAVIFATIMPAIVASTVATSS